MFNRGLPRIITQGEMEVYKGSINYIAYDKVYKSGSLLTQV